MCMSWVVLATAVVIMDCNIMCVDALVAGRLQENKYNQILQLHDCTCHDSCLVAEVSFPQLKLYRESGYLHAFFLAFPHFRTVITVTK